MLSLFITIERKLNLTAELYLPGPPDLAGGLRLPEPISDMGEFKLEFWLFVSSMLENCVVRF